MLKLILFSLITWRVSSLATHEDGPDDVLAKARDVIGVSYDEQSQCKGKNVVADGLCCLWCASLWVGWAVAAFDDWRTAIWKGLAYSAAAIAIERWVKR